MSDILDSLPQPLGEAPSFLAALEHVSRAAPLDRPFMIIGERGTGKELVAARLHFLSRRWDLPFVKVNCAALSEELLDSELFGHESGAFTGANRRHAGRFERADRGTLLLDEIATASLRVQEKILRIIEYGEFERLGGETTRRVDVRVVGATNVDLPRAVAAGRFRADLLDRLAFDVVTLPPLRGRPGDVASLADHFGRAMARELGWSAFPGFAPAALETLEAHPWPGNVRELKNAVERACYRWGDGTSPVGVVCLDPFDSPYRPGPHPAPMGAAEPAVATALREAPADPPPKTGLTEAVRHYEAGLIRAALEANRYNRRHTATQLALTYDQLRGYIKKHGLATRASETPGPAPASAPASE